MLESSTDDDAIQLLENNRRNNGIYNINQKKLEHVELLSFSKKIGSFWICIALCQWFLFCCRWYVWILYARSLGQYNEASLAFGVYSVYFIQAFGNLSWGWIADQYTYDIIGVILAFFVMIGLIFESLATNYILLLIGTIIVDIFRAHNALALAFLTKYLPNYYAVKYQSLRMALIGGANLLGPILGGILTTYCGIKSPFYVSTIIALLLLLFLIFGINGTQKKIHCQQSEFKQLYDILNNNNNNNNNESDEFNQMEETNDLTNIEYQFPVSTDKYIEQQRKENNLNIESQSIWIKFKNGIPALTSFEWFNLINILVSNACIISIEGAFATYFVIFCIDLFNISVIESTLMISLIAFIYIITCILTRKVIQKYKNKDDFMVEFISLIIISTFMIFFTAFSNVFSNIFGSFWLWTLCIISGLSIGTMNMLQEVILLTIQPKQHCGKISGAKVFVRNMARAFITFIIGSLWSLNIYFFVYIQTAFYLIALISTISMMIGYHLHGQQNRN